MRLTGAQIIIEILKEYAVDTVFGYPGSAVLELYDELYKHSASIKHILTSHEQGAAHSADGYARASGKTGVCIATSGPGATNLVTGIATAYMDSIPLLAITCNVERDSLGKDSFQEVDIAGITMPVTKHGYIIKDIDKLESTFRRAFEITKEGRPGPVIVDITKNVLVATAEFEGSAVGKTSEKINTSKKPKAPCKAELSKALEILKKAKRPLILSGGGVVRAKAGRAVEELAERLSAPVVCSLMGKGGIDETKKCFAGMVGSEGNRAANALINSCDVVVALGVRFSDRMTSSNKNYAAKAKIVQVDIDPAEINKNVAVSASVLGELSEVLAFFNENLEPVSHVTWAKIQRSYKLAEQRERNAELKKRELNGKAVIAAVQRLTGGNALITTEVGRHQLLAATGYKTTEEGVFITSGGLGTMGYGLSAAMGAKLARPDKTVINFAGDGCFRMNMNDLLTASRHNIPLVQIVFDNQILGLVHSLQDTQYEGRHEATEFDDRLNFVKLAEALGVKAYRVDKYRNLEKTLKKAIEAGEPVVVDVVLTGQSV